MIRRFKFPLIILGVILLAGAVGTAGLTRVKTGTRLVCKYHHVLKEDVRWVIVARWNADDYTVRETTTTCAKHRRLEKLHKQALAALSQGDTAKAKQIFEEIRQVDPTFTDVNTQLDRINAGQSATTSPGDSGTPSTPVPVADLAAILAAGVPGFSASGIEKGDGYASRNYRPDSQERMQSLLVTLHATAGQGAAEKFVARVDKVAFSLNARDVTVNGYAAYFGTDRSTYATLAWAKGTVAIELQAHASTGDPAGLAPDLIAVAAAFK